MADMFATLNATIAGVFGRTPITYFPSSTGVPFQIKAVLDTPREMDEQLDGTYLEIFLDGNDPLLVVRPAKGDMVVTSSGYQYLVHRIDVDQMNGINMIGRLKGRPPTVPDPYGPRPY